MRYKSLSLIIYLSAGFLLAGCQRAPRVVATVGSEKLSVDEFINALKDAPDYYATLLNTDAGRNQFLDVLVKEKIMIASAKELGIDRSAEYKKMLAEYRKDFENQFKEYRENLLVQEYYRRLKSDYIKVSDQEVRDFYNAQIARYQTPQKIIVSFMVFTDEAKAQEALSRLKNGEGFIRLSREYAGGSAADDENRKLEYTQPGSLTPELEEAIFKLGVGEVSGIIKAETNYYIVRKDSAEPQPAIPFDSAAQTIQPLLEKKKFDAYMDGLKKRFTIRVNKETLKECFYKNTLPAGNADVSGGARQ